MAIRLRELLGLGEPPPTTRLRVFLDRHHPGLLSFREAARLHGLKDETPLLTDRRAMSRFLRPGDSFTIEFIPAKGPGTASGLLQLDAAQIPGKVEPFPEGDDVDLVEAGLEIRVRNSGGLVGSVVTSNGPGANNVVRFVVPASQAGQTWTCRFRNLSDSKQVAFGQVTFPSSDRLITTEVPIRLLNQAGAQLLAALAPRIRIDGDGVEVSFSREMTKLLGDTLSTLRIPFDGKTGFVADLLLGALELEGADVRAFHGNGRRFRVDVSAEFSGELSVGSVDRLAVIVTFQFERIVVSNRPTIDYTVDVSAIVDIELDVGVLIVLDPLKAAAVKLALPKLEAFLQDVVSGIVKGRLEDKAIRQAIGSYLSEGLAELVRTGNSFVDLEVDDGNLVVRHRGKLPDPPAPLPPIVALDPQEDATALANLAKIDHIVVLMMENRSFDHMLGYLALIEGRTDVNGLTADMSNTLPGGGATKVHRLTSTVFPRSPEHGHDEVIAQIAGGKMSGFLRSFADAEPLKDPEPIMGFYDGEQLTTYDLLAREFIVCDNWFCAFPGPTWPNRFCTLSGATPIADNVEIDSRDIGYVRLATIFDALSADGVEWAYYEHDVGFLRMVNQFRLDNRRVIPVETRFSSDDRNDGFFVRAANGTLPPVTFIDPNFVDLPPRATANDDLAPTDVGRGQVLIGRLYDALVSSPQWPKTLFVVTYDEHGGFFDHVPPPGTPPAGGDAPSEVFSGVGHLGVRVPALVVSPWVPAAASHLILDHTSIVKTILLRFLSDRMPDFGQRVREARHLGALLTNDAPRLNVPRINLPTPTRPSLIPGKGGDDFRAVMTSFAQPRFVHS